MLAQFFANGERDLRDDRLHNSRSSNLMNLIRFHPFCVPYPLPFYVRYERTAYTMPSFEVGGVSITNMNITQTGVGSRLFLRLRKF